MSEVRIPAESRSEFGKGAARRIRRAHKVPAVLYGHGEAPRHVTLPGHQLMLALKTPNVLLSLDLEGGGSQLALAKDVQRDPIKGFLEHIDLVAVRRGERVKVNLAVQVEGDVPSGQLLTHTLNEVEVEAEATHLPTPIVIDVSGFEPDQDVKAGQLPMPAGTTLLTDPEAVVISLSPAPSLEAFEADLADNEAALGVVREEKDEAPAEAGADA
ncbi:MAG: 50S ribosomal protein L25/general stress protein Ctc [Actinomycetota bacterium]|nr:50S ribosomal protein L25/general stress protein Ctc [Actinomycetota bacterium]